MKKGDIVTRKSFNKSIRGEVLFISAGTATVKWGSSTGTRTNKSLTTKVLVKNLKLA